MEQKRLNLYFIDMKYIRNLAKADDHVMSVSPQARKETRPFVGIVCMRYKEICVPLSSPKPKHNSMKNNVDFTKIMGYRGLMEQYANAMNCLGGISEYYAASLDGIITVLSGMSNRE